MMEHVFLAHKLPAARLLPHLCFWSVALLDFTDSDLQEVMHDVRWACGFGMRVVVFFFEVRCYMTAHCVAPQQSLMMATPDFVMDGLLGGGSNIGLLGFGAS